YVDYEEAGCVMVVGADASANHPVIAIRFRRAMHHGARIVVINPKRIELVNQADLWIAQRPGTDVTLFNAMAKVILDEGLANLDFVRARTEGFETWRQSLEPFTLEQAERVTGVPKRDIAQAARWYARPPFAGSCLVWGMGITQHVNGIHNAHTLLNLSLVTGQLGFPGAGISPLRGQNNVQGCGDAGCIPTNLPGYQSYGAETLAKFERAWGVREALGPRGQARADWWITSERAKRVARRLGVRVDGQFDYANAADVFDEMARLTPFLGGISHARLDREGGLQWPCPTADHPGTRFLYAESFPRGKGKFVPAIQTVEAAELPDPDYPFILNTGRLLYHWHGGTITRRVEGLLALAPRLEVAIHPVDAARLGIGDGDGVRVTSRRGELTGNARVSSDVRPGAIFVPFVKLQDSAAN